MSRRITHRVAIAGIFKELRLNKSDNKRLRFMRLKDAVFICLQSAHGPICLWDNYPVGKAAAQDIGLSE